MGPTMSDLGIDQLTAQQRLALALEIWASLEADRPLISLTDSQRAELARRDAQLDAQPGISRTWRQIRASVEAGR